MNKKTVAICFIINSDYYTSRYSIDDAIRKTGIYGNIYVHTLNTSDPKIISYTEFLVSEYNAKVILDGSENIAVAINEIIAITEEENICIFPANLLVLDGWAEELWFSDQAINNSGIIGIRDSSQPISFTSIINKFDDNFAKVIQGDHQVGIIYNHKSTINKVGPFNEMLNSWKVLSEYCERTRGFGFNNYYVRNQISVCITPLI